MLPKMLMQIDVNSRTRAARLKAAALKAMVCAGGTYEIDAAMLKQIGSFADARTNARSALVVGVGTVSLVEALIANPSIENIRVVVGDRSLISDALTAAPSVQVYVGDATNLRLDPASVEAVLRCNPPTNLSELVNVTRHLARAAGPAPWIPAESIDHVLIDLQLNLLSGGQARSCLAEIYRTLRSRDGRLDAFVLLVDEPIPDSMNGVSLGAGQLVDWLPTEGDFVRSVSEIGFHGMTMQMVGGRPVVVVGGKEVRLWRLSAFKGKEGFCWDRGHAVVYRGPWSEVTDDDGHRYRRGDRVAVCDKTYRLLAGDPYAAQFEMIPCYAEPQLEAAVPFDCNTPAIRAPAVTKGLQPLSVVQTRSGSCDGAEPNTACGC